MIPPTGAIYVSVSNFPTSIKERNCFKYFGPVMNLAMTGFTIEAQPAYKNILTWRLFTIQAQYDGQLNDIVTGGKRGIEHVNHFYTEYRPTSAHTIARNTSTAFAVHGIHMFALQTYSQLCQAWPRQAKPKTMISWKQFLTHLVS